MIHRNLTREERRQRRRIVKVTALVILALVLAALTYLNIKM